MPDALYAARFGVQAARSGDFTGRGAVIFTLCVPPSSDSGRDIGSSAGSLKASSGCAVRQVTREEWAWPPETRRVCLYPVQPSLVDTCIRVDTYLSLGHA
jgi:hypothetical protein